MKAMKKFSALILLAVVSLAISAVLLLVNCASMHLSAVTTIQAVFTSIAFAFGTAGFYKKFRSKLGINALLFWIFAYAPELFIGAGTLLWAYYQSASGYPFLGMDGLLYFYAIPITGAVYAVCGAIFTIAVAGKLKETQQ